MKKIILSVAMLGLLQGAQADSLWPGGRSNFGNASSLVTDIKALNVGDLVTVRIIEAAEASQSTNTKTNKMAQGAVAAGVGGWSNRSTTLPINSYGAGASTNSQGGGSTQRGSEIVTTLTARVVNIQENGNLLIEGRRTLKINQEKQHISLRGIIRPADVGSNNIVLSSSISDAQILYEGVGPLSEKSDVGIFTRILDWIGIF
jgi:flagellar L-ring protein precursor FlgH